MLIVDAHEDLAYNVLTFGRDYTRSALETRRLEAQTEIPARNGDALLGWPEYQRGQVAVVFGTLFVSPAAACKNQPWETQCYADYEQAHRLYRRQVEVYQRLADDHPEKFRLLHTQADLVEVLQRWEQNPEPLVQQPLTADETPRQSQERRRDEVGPPGNPVGIAILMEGAEGVRDPDELEEWWQWGVRMIGPAWAGTRFCGGTRAPGPLTNEGYALLDAMAGLGFTLDLSHMDEKAALQALDVYPGPVIASHANALALLKGSESNRHLSDRVIAGLLERGGIIGVVPFNAFLKVGWRTGDRRQEVTLHHLAAHIDHICQMSGDARHVGLGSDFEGGFGLQSTPAGIDTIADLQKLVPILAEKGYAPEDIAAIMGGNWRDHLQRTLPTSV